jgi:hypothetical protein
VVVVILKDQQKDNVKQEKLDNVNQEDNDENKLQ